MEDEKTEIIEENYEVSEDSSNGVSIVKPLLGVIGVIAAGIGGFIFYKKRKNSKKYAEIPLDDLNENSDDKTEE